MSSIANNPETLIELAADALAENRPQLAERRSEEVLRDQPLNVSALAILGSALHAQERFADAETAFLKLTELVPTEPNYWMNVGTARRCAGKFEEALFAFAKAAALGAGGADFFYNVALTHIDRNDYESARALLKKAFALAPDDAEIRFRYAWCCYECLQTDEALEALAGWDEKAEQSGAVSADIGHLLLKLGEPERAEPAIRRAVRNDAFAIRSRLTLGQVLERTNQLEEAKRVLAELTVDPRASELGTDLSLLRAQLAQRFGEHETAIELFKEVLAGCKELHNRHFVEYPLAKALDAAKHYEEAFSTLVDAHRSQVAYLKRSVPLAVLRGAPTFGIADYPCNPTDVAAWDHSTAPSTSDSPVFIVAFPRSGTTLLELALDAHPQLKSMDEQPFLQNALDDILNEGVRYPAELSKLSVSQLDKIRERYRARVARKIELNSGQRLVDKNPLNLLRLPLIKRLYPNAHILLAIRHPCDVLLSCFMQHFRAPDFAMLCQDLPTLAAGYVKAFDFWYSQHALLRPKSRELRYEGFVSDFEVEIRRIIDFLELPWNDAVLAPGARALDKRFISTPSYSQVVQPVNRKAVGRWRSYEAHFQSVLPLLRPYLDRWNY